MLKEVKALGRAATAALLSVKSVRNRIAYELTARYFSDLNFTVPLGIEVRCPVFTAEAWGSFNEIFIEREYMPAFDVMPIPDRWLDIGCYTGYFSLFVAWMRARNKLDKSFAGLLIDGDLRVEPAVRQLMHLNQLNKQLSFVYGAIAQGSDPVWFAQKPFLSSAVNYASGLANSSQLVQVVTPQQIIDALPPPYDLVKIDIEGGEYDFLMSYKSILDRSRFLLMEWHSWHPGGGGQKQLEQMTKSAGFELLLEVQHAHDVYVDGQPQQCGISLYRQA